jgi:putative transposase
MILTYSYKLYLNASQEKALERWMRICAWIYNRALEQRIKAYERREESISYQTQQALLTEWRGRIDNLRLVPVAFERDALRRVDRGMKAFFRRCRAGQKPGFPRFRSCRRYRSLECLAVANYLQGARVRIPNLGLVRCRGRLLPVGKQRGLRIIHRESGWYAQIILDNGVQVASRELQTSVGIDVGLASFATLSTGEKIENPRFGRKAQQKTRSLQRRVSRRKKGSANRRKAVQRLARQHERVASQRRSFCHDEARKIINRFDLIAFENLSIAGMVHGNLARSIHDAAWSLFLFCLIFKAENAGKSTVAVNPRGTSQECPRCGAVAKKSLSEREHICPCGARLCRDHASAQVILARALGGNRGTNSRVEEPASTGPRVAASASRSDETRMQNGSDEPSM